MRKRCVVLVGMPGAGKSTVGAALAKALDAEFIDTDDLLREACGGTLGEVMATKGVEGFRALEAQVLQGLEYDDAVIATGGSAVLDEGAMQHLKGLGTVVFLDVPVDVLKERVGDAEARGVVGAGDMTLDEIYALRGPLYRKYADVVVAGGAVEDVVGQVWAAL